MKKFLCECGKLAKWVYAPANDWKHHPYFCDDCVPRGCSCNDEYDDPENGMPLADTIKWFDEKGIKWKWKEEGKSISQIDDDGREFPCIEYSHSIEGWEAEQEEMDSYIAKGIKFETIEV